MWLILVLFTSSLHGAISDPGVFRLPTNCRELLPDQTPFLQFFESVAKGQASKNPSFSKRLFKVLALREKLIEEIGKADGNPIELLVRQTLCFYREQRDPLRPIPYDDTDFLKFLLSGIGELEKKAEAAVLQEEVLHSERMAYETQLEKTQGVIDRVWKEAEKEAGATYSRISRAARKKVHAP